MGDLERGGVVLTDAQRTEVLRAVAQSYCCKGGPCMAGGTHHCPAEVQHHWAWKHAEFALAAIGKAGLSIHPAAAQGEDARPVMCPCGRNDFNTCAEADVRLPGCTVPEDSSYD